MQTHFFGIKKSQHSLCKIQMCVQAFLADLLLQGFAVVVDKQG